MVESKKTVFVGNLHENVSEPLLFELFLQAGPVKSVTIPKDRISGKQRNFAFVTFKHEVSVSYSINLMNGIKLFDTSLKLNVRQGNKNGNDGPGDAGFIDECASGHSEIFQTPLEGTSNDYLKRTSHCNTRKQHLHPNYNKSISPCTPSSYQARFSQNGSPYDYDNSDSVSEYYEHPRRFAPSRDDMYCRGGLETPRRRHVGSRDSGRRSSTGHYANNERNMHMQHRSGNSSKSRHTPYRRR